MRSLPALLVLLAALPCSATILGVSELHVDPPVPTALTLVELRAGGISSDGGAPDALQMSVVGNVITLDLDSDSEAAGVTLAVVPWGIRTPLGRFVAGRYELIVRFQGAVLATAELTVLPAHDDAPAYERVLVPFLYSGPGAFGAQWETTLGLGFPETELVPQPLGPRPHGLVLPLSRRQARDGTVTLRFRDAAHMTPAEAIDVPAARTADTSSTVRLRNIPLDPRFRRTLRIYDIDGVERTVSVSIADRDAKSRSIPLVRDCNPQPCDAPAFAQLDLDALLSAGTPRDGNVDVVLIGPRGVARLWALVSVTDNETQETTIVTPDRAGTR